MTPTLGSFIRARRIAIGRTQTAIAKAVGVTSQFLSNLECARAAPPRNDGFYRRLATELNVDPDDLFARAGLVPPDMRAVLPDVVRMWRQHELGQ